MLRLSVVIPTFNRLASLQRTLAGLEHQTFPRAEFEIVVVSDGSCDGTNEFLRAQNNLGAVIQENQGVAAARNAGIARASGEIVLFVDDDVMPTPQLIAEHLATHARHRDDVIVLCPMLTPRDFKMASWVRLEQAMLEKQYADMSAGKWHATARQFYTGNTSLLRRHVVQAGGFDPSFRRAEDVELAYRLAARGLKFVFNAHAIGYHYADRSFKSWFDIPYTYGRNDVIFTRDKNQTWLLPTVFDEFRKRNPLIRALAHACLDHSRASARAITLLKFAAQCGDRCNLAALPRVSFSGIFNLRYYQGVADELGGRAKFFARVARAEKPARVPGEESREQSIIWGEDFGAVDNAFSQSTNGDCPRAQGY